jgi:DNA repair exonuclease SbcCD ATPase subunit
MMSNCPVCDAIYNEGQESCTVCNWPLNNDSQKIIIWAKGIWEERSSIKDKYNKRKTKDEESLVDKIKKDLIDPLQAELMDLKKSQEQLQAIHLERDRTLKEQLESINSNIKNIEQNQKQLATKNQENFSRSQEEIEKISNRVGDLENNIRSNERANRKMVSNQSSYPSETSVSYPELSPQTQNPISLEESNLAKRYNRDRDAFSQQAINVTATEESLTKLRIGSSSRVIFEKNRRGNYSIIKENGTEYLVPSNNLRLNQHNYKAIEDFFDCKNLQLEGNFELLKPARVSALPGGETWQLEERGILQF